jgi:hypothetical protein
VAQRQWLNAHGLLWQKVLSGELSVRAFAHQAGVARNATLAAQYQTQARRRRRRRHPDRRPPAAQVPVRSAGSRIDIE